METQTRRSYRATGLAEVMRIQGRRNDWLAQQAGISEATVTRMLRGERRATEEVASKIAAIFHLPLTMLFDLSHESEQVSSEQEAAVA